MIKLSRVACSADRYPLQLMRRLLAQISLPAQLLLGMLRIEARVKLPRLRLICLELPECAAI